MNKISPNLMVEDVKKTAEFYQNVLGFDIGMAVPDEDNPVWASLSRGNVEVMLQEKKSLAGEYSVFSGREVGGTFNLYIETNDIQNLYDACKSNNVPIVKDMNKTFYGADEFAIQDPNGYVLVFAQHGNNN